MVSAIDEVRASLKGSSDPEFLERCQRFSKEKLLVYGVRTAEVNRIAKRVLKGKDLEDKAGIFRLCEDLWQSGYLEECVVACVWAHSRRKEFLPGDMATFERWVDKYVNNWAACDTLCNHTTGALLLMYPELISGLSGWTGSANRWKRRAAAVSLIVPTSKGYFLDEVFAIAEALLTDTDDLVQKGYGWMLKAASRAHPDEVFAYVVSRKSVMPRTAFRYSLEKMPEEWRELAMKK